MKRLSIITILGLLILLAAIPSASADSCGTVRYAPTYSTPSYVAPSYVTPTYNTALVAIIPAVFVPATSYTVGVSAPAITTTAPLATVTAPAGSVDIQQQILAELKALRQDHNTLKSEVMSIKKDIKAMQMDPQTELKTIAPKLDAKTQADVETAVGLLVTHCGKCHEAKMAGAKGDGFVMLDGNKLAQISERDAAKMSRLIKSGKMPPAPASLDQATRDSILKVLP
jgi:hypothetical protein